MEELVIILVKKNYRDVLNVIMMKLKIISNAIYAKVNMLYMKKIIFVCLNRMSINYFII